MPKIKLSRENKKEIEFMVNHGFSYPEIAHKFGVTAGYISIKFGPRPKKTILFMDHIVYPNIAHWMYQNEISRTDMADITGMSSACVNNILNGKRNPNFQFIRSVLQRSGMPFEEAFTRRHN